MTVWTDYVKQYAKEKNLSYKESLKQAGPSYKQHKEKPCPKGHAVCSCSAEPPTPTEVVTPPTIIETPLKKRNLIFPTPYRKVKLNIIEDDAVELPKIEPPPTQTRELTETIETTDEPIKQKKKKSRKVKLDIQGEHLPPLVSETEEELNKTSIPKLKEMLKELNFTKFAKFKKQDYVDKILELKNIPKGVWWRGKYDFLYNDLKELYYFLNNEKNYYKNIFRN